MFSLKWMAGAGKQIFYWASGAAVITIVFKAMNSFLQARAVRKSEGQAQKDGLANVRQAEDAEKDWTAQGKATDKAKDST